ncbi:MAG TPA: PRC-barrel domain-containing protein [Chthoniobacter sp.]|nr:PRC-barrel domain-containing protein [Chthoniobacter sp.]
MKAPILIPIFVALAGSISSAAELSVFRVCQDQRVIHTSDGAEAGRVEYIVVDPADQHVVSTVISGGVVGERLIAVPYNSLRFTSNSEITLTEITRERLVSAPVIERTQISASVIEPSIIQRTTTHFSARGDVRGDRTTVEGSADVTARPNDPRSNAEAASRRDAQARTQSEAERTRTENNGNRPPGATTNERDAATAAKERGEANQDPNAATKSDAQRKHNANAKGEAEAAAKNKTDAARPENAEENRSATKPNHDANNNSPKADANREHNENARPQDEAQPGRERKGAADRNASEETAKGRKPAEETATDSKRPPKKAQEPAGEEKARNEQRSPQL